MRTAAPSSNRITSSCGARTFREHAVICFFHEVLEDLAKRDSTEIIGFLTSEAGPSPMLRVEVDGTPVVAVQPGIGAPMAAFVLEELIALGARTVVACGGAGVLDRDIDVGQSRDSDQRRAGRGHIVSLPAAHRVRSRRIRT